MIKHSAEYDKAVIDDSRRQYVRAVFDLVDPDAVLDGTESNSESVQSKAAQLVERGSDETTQKAVTLEHNRWKLDGTWEIVDPHYLTGQRGWDSDVICDAEGNFSEPYPYVLIKLSNVEILQDVTLQFSQYDFNGYPVDFTLEIFANDMLLASKEYTGNADQRVVFDGFTVNFPDTLKITVKKWSIGNRRARVIRYLPGLYEQWDNTIIKNVDIYTESTFSGLSIPYSTCTIEVYNENYRFDPYAPNSIFKSIEDRQAVTVDLGMRLADGSIEWLPGGVYFQQSSGWTLQQLTVQWSLLDIIGMLVNRRFVMPSTLPTTLGGWIEAIMSSLGVNFRTRYIVDEDIASSALTATADDVTGKMCGELIRLACMASNTWPHQDFATGYLRISKIERVEGNKIALDNMPEYPTMSENSNVSDITFKLYNDSSGNAQEVTFPGTNTECDQSLSVQNPFVHTEADARKAVVSCLMEYGGNKFSVSSRGNPCSETGDLMSVETQFKTEISARLRKQQLKIEQGVMRNVLSEFVQTPNDMLYSNIVVLTGSGTWTVPYGVTDIRFYVIGGGTGGQGGGGGIMTGEGADDEETTGGENGSGGNVFISEIGVNKNQTFSYSCGIGGSGGSGGFPRSNGVKGTEGTKTIFGDYSSENGKRYTGGVMIVQTGSVYASSGSDSATNYGCGGKGGKFGENGFQTQRKDSDDEIITNIIKSPTKGENGKDAKSGCVIVEW